MTEKDNHIHGHHGHAPNFESTIGARAADKIADNVINSVNYSLDPTDQRLCAVFFREFYTKGNTKLTYTGVGGQWELGPWNSSKFLIDQISNITANKVILLQSVQNNAAIQAEINDLRDLASKVNKNATSIDNERTLFERRSNY